MSAPRATHRTSLDGTVQASLTRKDRSPYPEALR